MSHEPDRIALDASTLTSCRHRRILEEIKQKDTTRPDNEKIFPKTYLFNSFFYKQLSTSKKGGADPYLLVEKWTKRVNLFDKRFIIVPINE